jgi:transcriptional regulator with XRE-family HTH domain
MSTNENGLKTNRNTEMAARLKRIIYDSGLSLAEFAQRTQVSKNTLVNYRDAATSPAGLFLERVCRQFSVNPSWLVLGEGGPYGSAAGGKPAGEHSLVPLLKSRVASGPDGEILYGDIEDHYPFKLRWIEKLVGKGEARRKGLFLVRVQGDSMLPTVNQGEVALVDSSDEERERVLAGRIYLVVLPDGATAMKRLVLSGDREHPRLVCLSENTAAYRPFEFALDPEKPLKNYVLGRIRWVGKEFE